MSRRNLLASWSLFPAAYRIWAQEQRPTFSTDVKVVGILATVRDRQGRIVKDLTQDDFLLEEDGRRQVIKYFSQESNLPLSLGLLVDTSGSQRRVLGDERSASLRFLQQVLRVDRDVAFVIHFDFEVELLQDFTASRSKLERALSQLEVATDRPRSYGRGPGYPGGRRRYPRGGGTALYDAVMLAADELMKKQAGRKALIVLTDGVDTGSKMSLSHAIESAQRADTLVYGILFEDPDAYSGVGIGGVRRMPGGRFDGDGVLERISRETGARFFQASNRQSLGSVYAAIEEDLRNQYSIGYTPDRAGAAGFRAIQLSTRQRGPMVQTRSGYYAI